MNESDLIYDQNHQIQYSSMQEVAKSDDANLNKLLFSVYRGLVEPLRFIENKTIEIDNISAQINKKKKFQVYPEFNNDLIKGYPFILILLFVIIYILFPILLFNSEMFTGFWSYIISIIAVLGFLPMTVFIIVSIVGTIIGNIKAKKDLENLGIELELSKQELDKKINEISDKVAYVPPAYRYSTAVDFFADSFENCRVSTLKEAVNTFDAKMQHNEIIAMNNTIASIAYYQASSLNDINKKIW